MTDFPETRDSLIVQLQTPENRLAWERFVDLYRPTIVRLARSRGLQESDAEDLAQKVLMAVATALVDRDENDAILKFRHWLRRVAHNAIINAILRKPTDVAAGGTTIQELLLQQSQPDETSDVAIEFELRRELYLRAALVVQRDVAEKTWRAFEMTVLNETSVEDAATLLEIPVGSVYAARSRVMRRLKQAVVELDRMNEA